MRVYIQIRHTADARTELRHITHTISLQPDGDIFD